MCRRDSCCIYRGQHDEREIGRQSSNPCTKSASRLHLRRHSRLEIVRHYPQIKADAMPPRTNPPCSSLLQLMCVFATMAPPSHLCRRLARAVGRGRPLPSEQSSSRARARWAAAALRLLTAALVAALCVRKNGVALPLQRRKLQSFRARMDAGASAEFPRKDGCGSNPALKQPRHPHAAHAAAPCCSPRRSRETRYSAR